MCRVLLPQVTVAGSQCADAVHNHHKLLTIANGIGTPTVRWHAFCSGMHEVTFLEPRW